MRVFNIGIGEVKIQSSTLESLSDEVNSLATDLTEINNNLCMSSAIDEYIKVAITRVTEENRNLSAEIVKLRDAMIRCANLYEVTETRITGSATSKDKSADRVEQIAGGYDKTSAVFDDDKKNGTYGGDQGDMAGQTGIWFFGSARLFENKALFKRVRSYSKYKDYSEQQIADLLNQINQEGCGYVALTNNIFTEFIGHEDEFQKAFGFPMYDKNGKFNYDYLILDIYAETDDKYYLNEPYGISALYNDVAGSYATDADFKAKYGVDRFITDPDTGIQKYNPVAEQKVLDQYQNNDIAEFEFNEGTTQYSLSNRVRHYLREKNVDVDTSMDFNLETRQVLEDLDKGDNVNIICTGFNMYNQDGTVAKSNVGGHWMTITDVTDDGRYVVSSWGKRYYLKASELKDPGYLITNVTP